MDPQRAGWARCAGSGAEAPSRGVTANPCSGRRSVRPSCRSEPWASMWRRGVGLVGRASPGIDALLQIGPTSSDSPLDERCCAAPADHGSAESRVGETRGERSRGTLARRRRQPLVRPAKRARRLQEQGPSLDPAAGRKAGGSRFARDRRTPPGWTHAMTSAGKQALLRSARGSWLGV